MAAPGGPPGKRDEKQRDAGGGYAARMTDDAARDLAEAAGGHVDMNQVPHGRGQWYWLNPIVDAARAAAIHIADPLEVTIARENRQLPAGVPLPRTVFVPDARFYNIDHRPAGRGRWEYLTTEFAGSSQDLAFTNLGGGVLLENNQRPSAEDAWRLRQHFRHQIDDGIIPEWHDTTAGVDIVWVPEEGETPEPTEDLDMIDKDSGLQHDPKNRGENDQTGVVGERILQTKLINGKTYTVDRSRAHHHATNTEEHKTWAVNGKGVWRRYSKYSTLDWTNKQSVEDLNKWREQTYERAKFPFKRTERREIYTEKEREFLFTYVKDAGGDRPTTSMRDIAAEFNRRFPSKKPRNEAGITGVMDRLRKEFKKFGEMKKRPGRGANNKNKPRAGDKRTRREAESEEEEDDREESGDED